MQEKLLKQLKRIADALEKANELSIEKQKANISGLLSNAEKEWLLETQDKKRNNNE